MSKRLVAMGLLAAMLLSAGSMAQAEEIAKSLRWPGMDV